MNYQIVLHDERKRFGLLPRITIFHEIIVFLVINLTRFALLITTSKSCHKIMKYRFQTQIDNK